MNTKSVKIVEIAKGLLKAQGYFVDHLWHVDDVHFICEQNHIPAISNEEAMEVFSIAQRQFDGETGVSWPQLERALHTYVRRKAVLQDICESNK